MKEYLLSKFRVFFGFTRWHDNRRIKNQRRNKNPSEKQDAACWAVSISRNGAIEAMSRKKKVSQQKETSAHCRQGKVMMEGKASTNTDKFWSTTLLKTVWQGLRRPLNTVDPQRPTTKATKLIQESLKASSLTQNQLLKLAKLGQLVKHTSQRPLLLWPGPTRKLPFSWPC